jgi:hypothetical protein
MLASGTSERVTAGQPPKPATSNYAAHREREDTMIRSAGVTAATWLLWLLASVNAASQSINSSNPGKADIAKTIRAQGFNCPTVVGVSSRAQDAYGRVFRVRCGPMRGAGIDEFPYLRVTIQPDGEAIIAPWAD